MIQRKRMGQRNEVHSLICVNTVPFTPSARVERIPPAAQPPGMWGPRHRIPCHQSRGILPTTDPGKLQDTLFWPGWGLYRCAPICQGIGGKHHSNAGTLRNKRVSNGRLHGSLDCCWRWKQAESQNMRNRCTYPAGWPYMVLHSMSIPTFPILKISYPVELPMKIKPWPLCKRAGFWAGHGAGKESI